MFQEDFDLWDDLSEFARSRRLFLTRAMAAGAGAVALQGYTASALPASPQKPGPVLDLVLDVNGKRRKLALDPRTTLLDALREHIRLTGTKKGCDQGQCGACTVLVDGERVLACLMLAAQASGRAITTVEGLAQGKQLHPVQEAFVKHDALQCGYCTPGQVCSAVALLKEARRGDASSITLHPGSKLSDEDIRERMSGNLCRCGAYPNIVEAVREVQS